MNDVHNSGMDRRGFLTLSALAAGGLLAACTPSADSAAPDPDTSRGADIQPLAGIEKPNITIGFIPITCASPIVNAEPLGFYTKHGLTVTLRKYPGWADIRDAYIAGEIDASHVLAPMPLAISNGFGSSRVASRLALIGNTNGQAITLANKHRDSVRGPADMAGLVLAVPFEYSMHNFLLRHYLSTGGLNPSTDVDIRVMRPPDMVANLVTGNIDGYLSPDPFNQKAVDVGAGYVHVLSRDLWNGHPCCGFAVRDDFATGNPVTYQALLRAITDAALWSQEAGNRVDAATSMSAEEYLNQPPELLQAVLTGEFDDGTGRTMDVPDRIKFEPYPYESFGVWMLTQMQRWGLAPADAYPTTESYASAVRPVFDTASAAKALTDLGVTPPAEASKSEVIMDTPFDPADPAPWTAERVTA